MQATVKSCKHLLYTFFGTLTGPEAGGLVTGPIGIEIIVILSTYRL